LAVASAYSFWRCGAAAFGSAFELDRHRRVANWTAATCIRSPQNTIFSPLLSIA